VFEAKVELASDARDDPHTGARSRAREREFLSVATIGDDTRQFRPNIVVRSEGAVPFGEDGWAGGALAFDGADTPRPSPSQRGTCAGRC
jgi:hypothetical protein